MATYIPRAGATERVLADGRVTEPGVEITLTKDDEKDPHNKRLIDGGALVAVETKTKEDK